MDVKELSQERLDYLKIDIAYAKYDITCFIADFISNEDVYEWYAGVSFVDEDFPGLNN